MTQIDTDKPPYAVPSMEAIRALPWNGYNVVSTFSGAGGSCLGFRMAGYRVLWASEFVPAAADTYRANSDTHLDTRDIREVTPEDIIATVGLGVGELDVFEGSPPCASFSTSGKRHKGWNEVRAYSDVEQRTDDLFFEYARLLKGLQPKVFVAENVSGLVKGVAKGYFLKILEALKACGYNVEAKMLDAQWLGVPQRRQRVIFQGVRNDLGLPPAWPSPYPYQYTIRDAIPWITRVVHDTSGTHSMGEVTDQPCPTITVGVGGLNSLHFKAEGGDPDVENGPNIERFAIGEEWAKLRPGQSSDKYQNLVRPNPDAPCPTVTQTGGVAGAASVTHPHEPRKFSILELKRLCGFPDDFEVTGDYRRQWERLGRSVPPLMMARIAEAVRDGVLAKVEA